jgi:RimJ/RimL family protein N-acetyltransferase
MRYFPKISRGNIYLSPVNLEDCEVWTKYMNDSRITDGFNTTRVISSIDKKKDLLEKISKDPTKKVFTIVNKGNDKMLGMIDLFDIDYID